MLLLVLPLLGFLGGIGAALVFRGHGGSAAAAIALIPAAVFQIYAAYRLGREGLAHPGFWMICIMWIVCVAAGHFMAKIAKRRS